MQPTGGVGQPKTTAKESIRADTDAEADAIFEKLTLTLEQEGNDVSAIAHYQGEALRLSRLLAARGREFHHHRARPLRRLG